MLRKYRNALFDVIRAANLDPRRFIPVEEEIDGYQAFRLRAGDSLLCFIVRTASVDDVRKFGYRYTKYIRAHPRPQYPYNSVSYSQWVDFDRIVEVFKEWLETRAQRYITDQDEEAEDRKIPDFWAELDLLSGSSVDSQALQNTQFSQEEQTHVAESLKRFKEEVQKRELLSEEQSRLLHERIEYLVDSSKRLGRKDWVNGAIGALIGFTLQAALTTDVATQLIRLAGEALRWLAHTPLLLPQ